MSRRAKPDVEAILRVSFSALRRERETDGSKRCPDEETLAAYVERTLSRKTFIDVRDHLRSCVDCAELAAHAAAGVAVPGQRSKRWALAASLLAWLAGGAAVSFLAVTLAVSLVGSALIKEAERSLGRNLHVASFSFGLAGGPTVSLRGISVAGGGSAAPALTAQRARVVFDSGELLKGRLLIEELALVGPAVTLRESGGSGGPDGTAYAELEEGFKGSAIAGLWHLAPTISITDGRLDYTGGLLAGAAGLSVRQMEAVLSSGGNGGRTFNIQATVGTGELSASGTLIDRAGGAPEWQGTLSLGPLGATEIGGGSQEYGIMGLQSGTLTLEAEFEGGQAPTYAIGEARIRDGTLRGWGLLEPLTKGRQVPEEVAALSGPAPLPFDLAVSKWRYSGEGPMSVNLALDGHGFSITGDFTVSASGKLAGSGSVELRHAVATGMRKLRPRIAGTGKGSKPVILPIKIGGTIQDPRLSVNVQ